MTVSIVVPTRDRPDQLAACLDALAAQTESDLEVVVVDDGSLDACAVAAIVGRLPSAMLVRADGRGPAAARNAGARAARGDVVCFTDDDCRPETGWATALRGRIERGADVVAGPTVNGRPLDQYAAASQAMTNHVVDAGRDGERLTFAPTSNLACRAELARAEPFDETYPLAAGEDREWCDRVVAAGATFVLEDAAVVHHHQDLSLRRFVRQQLRYGRGARRYRAGGTNLPPRFYVDLLRVGFRQGPRVGALVVLAQLVVAVGYARG